MRELQRTNQFEVLCGVIKKTTKGKPTCVLAKTFKGQGFPGIADEMNRHGKALGAKSEEVVAHLKTLLKSVDGPKPSIPAAVLDAPKVDITGIKLSEAQERRLLFF